LLNLKNQTLPTLLTGRTILLGILIFFAGTTVHAGEYGPAQTSKKKTDSAAKPFWKTPPSVALRSAIIPGWGQLSNRQYWKVPLFYAGFGVCAYFINKNNTEYQSFREAYKERTDNNPNTIDVYDPNPLNPHPSKDGFVYTADGLLNLREQYRQYRDLTYIIAFGVYAANILDAYVYAELKDFNVSNDLSMRVVPVNFANIAGRNCVVTTLKFNFR
jgi:hypothetical protein